MHKIISIAMFLFFNRCYSHLSFGGPQLYTLPFTYGQYVVIELADKLYKSFTGFICASQMYVFHEGHKWEWKVD